MSDERVPHLPVRGARYEGENAQAYAGQAARLMFFTDLIARASGATTFRMTQTTGDGAILKASVHGPLAYQHVIAPPPVPPQDPPQKLDPITVQARLTWMPEGFMLTPRTKTAPDGHGLPPTEDGVGTAGGPLPQVILNQLEGNGYPEATMAQSKVLQKITAQNPNLKVTFIACAPLWAKDWEFKKEAGNAAIGVYIQEPYGGPKHFDPQFKKLLKPEYGEKRTGQWYYHRPQYARMHPIDRAILDYTNIFRQSEGQPPLYAPLKHHAGDMSRDIAYEIQTAGFYAHDSNRYRDGHETMEERSLRSPLFIGYGENLQGISPAKLEVKTSFRMVEGWKASPGHRANMLKDWHKPDGETECFGCLDPVLAADKDKVGATGVQIFRPIAGLFGWSGEGVRDDLARPIATLIGGHSRWNEPFLTAYPWDFAEAGVSNVYLCFLGRTQRVFKERKDYRYERALSVSAVYDDEGIPTKFRAVVLHTPSMGAGAGYVEVLEGELHDFANTAVSKGTHTLPYDKGLMLGRPVWSSDASHVALSYTSFEEVLGGRMNGLGEVSASTKSGFWGQKIHFVEFSAGVGWLDHGEDSLTIVRSFTPAEKPFGSLSCTGTYRLFPTYRPDSYGNETLSFIRVRVDSAVSFKKSTYYRRKFYGELIYPGGAVFVFTDLKADDSTLYGNYAIWTGFVRHLLTVDFEDPKFNCYLHYGMPIDDTQYMTANVMVGSTLVKAGIDPMKAKRPSRIGVKQELGGFIDGSPLAVLSVIHGTSGFPDIENGIDRWPDANFKALIVSWGSEPTSWRIRHGTDDGTVNKVVGFLVGPVVMWGMSGIDDLQTGVQGISECHYARFGQHAVYSGRIDNTFWRRGQIDYGPPDGVVDYNIWPLGEDGDTDVQWYSYATMGLPTHLKNNITPLGVI